MTIWRPIKPTKKRDERKKEAYLRKEKWSFVYSTEAVFKQSDSPTLRTDRPTGLGLGIRDV